MEITLHYQLTGDDTLECMDVHDPRIQANFVVGVVASLLLIAVGVAWITMVGGKAVAWISIGFGLCVCVSSILRRSQIRTRVRRQRNQLGPTELIVRETGLSVNEENSHSEVSWSRFVNLRQSKDHYLLYRSADLYSIVPKRGFANEEDLASFRDIIKRVIR